MALSQLLLNGTIAGATYIVIGLGFGLVYNTCRFFHFAHGAFFTWGAYLTFAFKVWVGLPFVLAVPLAIILVVGLGCGTELTVYRVLRRKGSSELILLLASLGMYIMHQNFIAMLFGEGTKTIRSDLAREGISIGAGRITPTQLLLVCVSVVSVLLLGFVLRETKLGRAIRAVANDPELAEVSGINRDRVIIYTFAIGSALAGIAGILVSLDIDLTPTMGLKALMMGIVAVLIGGIGSMRGLILAALLLGFAQQLAVLAISSAWQDSIAFIILLAFLLFRPQGFLGRKVRKAAL